MPEIKITIAKQLSPSDLNSSVAHFTKEKAIPAQLPVKAIKK
jgi:hypothetical protein